MAIRETDIQRAILDYLAARRIFHYRNNSGAFKNEQGGFYRFGEPGSPDIVCVIRGQYVGIEVKTPRGKQSISQRAFQRKLEASGGRYILARSVDDVMELL